MFSHNIDSLKDTLGILRKCNKKIRKIIDESKFLTLYLQTSIINEENDPKTDERSLLL